MSQGYKLVKRRSNPADEDSEMKYYAVAKSNGMTTLNSLCELISARSSMSSADVKAVIDGMIFILDYELRAGRLVQMGEFGNFRMSVGSGGAESEDDFTSSMLRKQKILFTPGKALRETKNNVQFQRIRKLKDNETGEPDNGEGETDDNTASGPATEI